METLAYIHGMIHFNAICRKSSTVGATGFIARPHTSPCLQADSLSVYWEHSSIFRPIR